MIRTDTQRLSTVYDILSESEGKTGDTLLRLLISQRIIVDGAKHTAEIRIEMVAILLAHHLLKDYRHLLLVYHVARSSHIRLGILEIHRGVDALDGGGEHSQHLVLVFEIRYHICGIYAGKGLVV